MIEKKEGCGLTCTGVCVLVIGGWRRLGGGVGGKKRKSHGQKIKNKQCANVEKIWKGKGGGWVRVCEWVWGVDIGGCFFWGGRKWFCCWSKSTVNKKEKKGGEGVWWDGVSYGVKVWEIVMVVGNWHKSIADVWGECYYFFYLFFFIYLLFASSDWLHFFHFFFILCRWFC